MSLNQLEDHENLIDAPIRDGVSGASLTQSAVRGFGWNFSGSVVRHGAGFLINVILARLLGPAPFGIVAIATIVISIGNLIVDSGLNASLVQKKELEQNDIKFVFTIQMVLGVSIYSKFGGSIVLAYNGLALQRQAYRYRVIYDCTQTL